ncbi:MAG: hypothetical protein PVH63_07840 [Balneolaceae bacterium]|jgi:hypothetical protein
MKRLFHIFFLLSTVITGFLLFSCNKTHPGHADNTLARVGNQYLYLREAKKAIPDFIFKQDSIEALRRYRDEWIQNRIILQEANRLGLSQKKSVREKLQKAREEVLREVLKDYIVASRKEDTTISDEEARSYFQAHKDQFALDEEFVRFRHVRTRTIKDARAARQALLDGVSWPEVARQYCLDPDAAIHESKQYWPISMAANNIDIMHRYLTIIGQTEISPIQRVNGIYHFVQLMDSRAKGEQPDLDWLIEQIKNWMLLNKRRRNFSSYVKNLYLKAKSNNEVEIFNVLNTKSNPNHTQADTLESNPTDE